MRTWTKKLQELKKGAVSAPQWMTFLVRDSSSNGFLEGSLVPFTRL